MAHHHAHPSADAQYEAALQTLRAHHHRVTGPRKALLRLLTHEHGPFTVEQLHQQVAETGCDLVTVYRSIAAMEEIAIVRRCDFGDGVYRYEFNTGEHHHHHIICRSCQHVETLDFCVADGLERMARQLGYSNVSHTLEIFGICKECQARRTAPAEPGNAE